MAERRPETIQMTTRQQLEAMVSARRHDIVDRLAASGPMSIKELAAQFGAQPSSLYHHIAILLEVGVVVESGSRMSGKRREVLYNTPAPRMRFTQALIEDKYREIMIDIGNALTRQMGRDFAAGFAHPGTSHEGQERNHGFFRLVGRPSPAQMARINACFAEISEILWNSGQSDEPLISLGWILAPLDDATETS